MFLLLSRYINGKSYMEDVADALEAAKEEIFITDWWCVGKAEPITGLGRTCTPLLHLAPAGSSSQVTIATLRWAGAVLEREM